MAEKIIHIEDEAQLSALFGQLDSNIHHIERNYNVSIINRDGRIKIIGEETAVADAEKSVICFQTSTSSV